MTRAARSAFCFLPIRSFRLFDLIVSRAMQVRRFARGELGRRDPSKCAGEARGRLGVQRFSEKIVLDPT
jgi:hypothetical protein